MTTESYEFTQFVKSVENGTISISHVQNLIAQFIMKEYQFSESSDSVKELVITLVDVIRTQPPTIGELLTLRHLIKSFRWQINRTAICDATMQIEMSA